MTVQRRAFIHGAALAAVAPLAACGAQDARDAARPTAPGSDAAEGSGGTAASVLLAFFSRPGEHVVDGGARRNQDVGNTKRLAQIIADRVRCDVHEIRAVDPYPRNYDAAVARNVREQDDDARPPIANPLDDIDAYDTVILASPIWNVRPPRIMATFAESLTFGGKTVIPVTTHGMSGLGTSAREYAELCAGARIGDGLAALGEAVSSAAPQVGAWITRNGLPTNDDTRP